MHSSVSTTWKIILNKEIENDEAQLTQLLPFPMTNQFLQSPAQIYHSLEMPSLLTSMTRLE